MKLIRKTNAPVGPKDKPEYDRLNKEWARLDQLISDKYNEIEKLEAELGQVKTAMYKLTGRI